MIRRLFRSWSQGPNNPPKPDWPPQKTRVARFEDAVLNVMFATPVPAVWDGKGVR